MSDLTIFEKNDFPKHGPEIDDIISVEVPRIVRWGTFYLLIVLFVILSLAWFIQYPDIVNATAKLTSLNAPKEVMAKASGKLTRLFVKEGDQIKKGKILGYIESVAQHSQVIRLSNSLDTLSYLIDQGRLDKIPPFLNFRAENLGELQRAYQDYLLSFSLFRSYILDGFYLKKKGLLEKDLMYFRKLHENLLEQKDLNDEDVILSEKNFDANRSLKQDKVISDFDFRSERSKLLNKKRSMPEVRSLLLNNEVQQNEKIKEIMELDNIISQQRIVFLQSLNILKSQVDDWKKRFLLTAPVDGKITFAAFLQENQELAQGQILCFVSPENTNYFAELYVPQFNFGKVEPSQEVILKFSSYPFEEFGYIRGKVDFISNISTDSGYLAKISLPNGMLTSHHKMILFRDGLRANGQIVTKKMRLLQRFYYGLLKNVEVK